LAFATEIALKTRDGLQQKFSLQEPDGGSFPVLKTRLFDVKVVLGSVHAPAQENLSTAIDFEE
jgi:hypothetical protein